MTKDYIVLGICPFSETPDKDKNKEFLDKNQNKMMRIYLKQLKRTFPCFPDRFTIKETALGMQVVIEFENEAQFKYATNIADELPYCWDEISQEELGKEYFKELLELKSKRVEKF